MSETRIDAHMHLWRLKDVANSWISSNPAWTRDFSDLDYLPLLKGARMEKAILVQAVEDEAENSRMLALARSHAWIAGFIGWLDLLAPDAETKVARLAEDPHAVGLRNWPMLQADPDWLTSPSLDAGFRALADSKLCYDALVRPINLPALCHRLSRTPGLRVCIDHGAYPLPEWPVDGSEQRAWAQDLETLADMGCVIKLSGFGHRQDGRWQPEAYDRFVSHVFKAFGPDRVIWASNWPTVLTECSFEDWLVASERWSSTLSPVERGDLFGGAATRFYGLKFDRSSVNHQGLPAVRMATLGQRPD